MQNAPETNEEEGMNPCRPADLPLINPPDSDDVAIRKRVQRVTSPEKWELKQVCMQLMGDPSPKCILLSMLQVSCQVFCIKYVSFKSVVSQQFSDKDIVRSLLLTVGPLIEKLQDFPAVVL